MLVSEILSTSEDIHHCNEHGSDPIGEGAPYLSAAIPALESALLLPQWCGRVATSFLAIGWALGMMKFNASGSAVPTQNSGWGNLPVNLGIPDF
jgi:hypothetical protein